MYTSPYFSCEPQPSMVRISGHALKRFRERTDLETNAEIIKFVDEALVYGKTIQAYSDDCRAFLIDKVYRGNCYPITYRGLLLLLSLDLTTVVTVYPLHYFFFSDLPRFNARAHNNRLLEFSRNRFGDLYHRSTTCWPA